MRLDDGICTNVAKRDYWLSQQADCLRIVERGKETDRETENRPHPSVSVRLPGYSSGLIPIQ